jgi:hypothetical protein
MIPSSSSSPTSHVERLILVHTSTPYQHPNARSFDNSQQPLFQDQPRRHDDWHHTTLLLVGSPSY